MNHRESKPVDTLDQYWQDLVTDGGGSTTDTDSVPPTDSSAPFALLEQLNDVRLLLHEDSTNTGAPDPTPNSALWESAPAPDTELDGYRLLREIGRGGMGLVYAAHQLALDRTVALKLIRSGPFTTDEDLSRFQAEAAAAGKLSHPGIVPVYDSGSADGQHYFSMELVEGPTLAQKMQAGPLEPRQAALFAKQMSAAVQHAHDHNILHRDIKPTNVLIDEATNQPRITDFGLAKLVTKDNAQLTQTGVMIGTPSYMSPEQALGESKRVSPASDVYSLGAILYEMLTGRAPFRAATSIETMRQVVDAEPATVRSLNPSVSRDLETICLKCLSKNPDARYTSANDLAQELDRYRAGDPILARPISAPGRLWRWCLRNPMLAVATSAIAILLVGGGGLHNLRLQKEVTNTRIAKEAAKASLLDAQKARELAERDYDRATKAVNRMLSTFADSDLADTPGAEQVRKELLEEAVKLEQQFLEDHADDKARILEMVYAERRMAKLYLKLGNLTLAETVFNKAIERAVDHPAPRPFEIDEAETSLRSDLATCLSQQGRTSEAIGRLIQLIDRAEEFNESAADEHRTEWLTLMATNSVNVANIVFFQGDRRLSKEMGTKAVGLFETLIHEHPDNFRNELNLASAHGILGLAWQYENDDLAKSHLDKSLDIRRRLSQEQPDVADVKSRLAEGLNNMAIFHKRFGRFEDAKTLYEEATVVREKLSTDFPSIPEETRLYAQALANSGNLLFQQGEFETALEHYEKSIEILEALIAKYPQAIKNKDDLFIVYRSQGEVHSQLDDYQSARKTWTSAKEILNIISEQSPENATNESNHASIDIYLAMAELKLGDVEQGLNMMKVATENAENLIQEKTDLNKMFIYEDVNAFYIAMLWVNDQQPKALAELERIATSPKLKKQNVYEAARISGLALVSATSESASEASQEQLAKKTIELLQESINKGCVLSTPPATDIAFQTLVEREDFKSLISKLQSKEIDTKKD